MNQPSTVRNGWYVLHTKPRQEERASRNLAAWYLPAFVPRISSRKDPDSLEVLFPGYIFVFCDAEMLFRKLLFTRGVAHVVSFGGKPAVVSDDLIKEIRRRTQNKSAAVPISFKQGDPVVIQSGVFRDLIGIFDREMSGHERVQILLNTLAYSARAEFPRSQVSALYKATIQKPA